MKKVFLIIITLVLSTLLFACDEGEQPVEEFVLPALQGKTKSEVLSTLSGTPITFTFDEVVAFNIPEDTFVQYGDNLKPGSKVAHGTSIVIYFSVHKNILPDLTGKSQSQVLTTLNNNYKLGTIDVRRVDSDEVEPGYFVGYGNGYVPGYEVPIDTEIIVYIAQEPAANYPVFFSKYLQGPNGNNALEIFNNTDEPVDLSKFKINLYLNGSEQISSSIPLSGTLGPKETFIIANSNASNDVKELADITGTLNFDGNDHIVLAFTDNRKIDAIGTYKSALTNLDGRILVRKPTSTKGVQEDFNVNDWNIYHKGYIEVFGEHPVQYPTTFTFDKSYLAKNYFEQPTGAVRVKYISNNDGDTARFRLYDTNQELDESVRFVGIDTREMNSGDPMAAAAQVYLQSLLMNATEIYLQWDPSTELHENYGRYLGLVWADGVLTNYMMVLNGYSQSAYNDPKETFIYEGVTMNQWFRNAEAHAKSLGLGIWAA